MRRDPAWAEGGEGVASERGVRTTLLYRIVLEMKTALSVVNNKK